MAWCRSDSLELVSRSVLKSYEFSPAAVFVVGSRTMRIKLWSMGKYKKRAPTLRGRPDDDYSSLDP